MSHIWGMTRQVNPTSEHSRIQPRSPRIQGRRWAVAVFPYGGDTGQVVGMARSRVWAHFNAAKIPGGDVVEIGAKRAAAIARLPEARSGEIVIDNLKISDLARQACVTPQFLRRVIERMTAELEPVGALLKEARSSS